MKYLIDANIFIQSKNFEYRFEYCRMFWDLIVNLHNKGVVFSIQAVKNELKAKNDELTDWINNELDLSCPTFFENELTSTSAYAKLINWANNEPSFTAKAKIDFASNKADAFLIAHAIQHGFNIVTAEKFTAGAKNRVMIPNVAKEFHVNTVTLCEFLQRHSGHNFSIK